jgi:hypothetical protein
MENSILLHPESINSPTALRKKKVKKRQYYDAAIQDQGTWTEIRHRIPMATEETKKKAKIKTKISTPSRHQGIIITDTDETNCS